MDDALFCESNLAWACWGDWHYDSVERDGAFYHRNPERLDPYDFSQWIEARGRLIGAWLGDVMRQHRAQLNEAVTK